MYKQSQKFVRTTSEIFERRKHSKNYRVVEGILVKYMDSPEGRTFLGASSIEKQAPTLLEVLRIGDYVRIGGEPGLLRRVDELLSDAFISGGTEYKDKKVDEVYASTPQGLLNIYRR